MSETTFQLLWHGFTVVTPSPAVDDALAYVVQHARHRVPVTAHVRLDVRPGQSGFSLARDGEHDVDVEDALALVDAIYAQVHSPAFAHASTEGWIRAHAAVVDVDDVRIALAGPSGVGKTTLALRLLLDGASVQGDESVLLRDGTALTVARPFHLKNGVELVVPEVVAVLDELPTLPVDPPIRAFHPDRVRRWDVTAAPIDHVVLLARGTASELVDVESTSVMHDLVESVFLMHETKSTVVREVAGVLRTARCHRLMIGDVAEASALVRGLASR